VTTRRGLLIATATAVVLILSFLLGGIASRLWWPRYIVADFGPIHPSSAVVCSGDVTPECAQEAAGRTNQSVAWIPSTTELASSDLISVQNQVFEELHSEAVLVSIWSNPDRIAPPWPVVTIIGQGQVRAEVRIDSAAEYPSAWVEWWRAGQRYSISIVSLSPNEDLDVAWIEATFHRIQYVSTG